MYVVGRGHTCKKEGSRGEGVGVCLVTTATKLKCGASGVHYIDFYYICVVKSIFFVCFEEQV